jgi:hypothetical protein
VNTLITETVHQTPGREVDHPEDGSCRIAVSARRE